MKQSSSAIEAHVREEVADPGAALAALLKGSQRSEDRKGRLAVRHRREPLRLADRRRDFLAVHLDERGLVVEGVDVRDRTEHVQHDHAFGACGMGGPVPRMPAAAVGAVVWASAAPVDEFEQGEAARARRPPRDEEAAPGAIDRSVRLVHVSAPCRHRASS